MPGPTRERLDDQVRRGPCAARFAPGAVLLLLLIPTLAGCPLLTTPPSDACTGAADCPSGYTCDRPTGNCLKQAADAARTDAVAVDATALDGLRPDQAVVDALSADQSAQDAASPDLPPVDGAALDQGLSDQMTTDLAVDASGPPDAGGPDAPTDSGPNPDAPLDAGGGEDAIGDASGQADTASLPDTGPATDAPQPPLDAGSADHRCVVDLIPSTTAEPRRIVVQGTNSTNQVVVAAGSVYALVFNSASATSSTTGHFEATGIVDVAVGDAVFAADSATLFVLEPGSLVLTRPETLFAEDLALFGTNTLYFAQKGQAHFWVSAVGAQLQPASVTTSPAMDVHGIHVQGSLLLALGKEYPTGDPPSFQLQAFNLADPAVPVPKGNAVSVGAGSCERAVIVGTQTYVACNSDGLFCVPVPDGVGADNPCGTWPVDNVHDVAAQGAVVYALGDSGLHRYTAGATPAAAGFFALANGRALALSVDGLYALVGLAADTSNSGSTAKVVAVDLQCAF